VALITSNGTGGGLASATTSWAGGVVPTSADDMTVLAADEITMDSTNVACNTLRVEGILNCDPTVNTAIAIEVGSVVANGGHVDFDVSLYPLTTCKFIYNNLNSASNVDSIVSSQGQITFRGAPKTRHAGLVGQLFPGDTTLEVDDVSGWLVGDEIVIESTDAYTSPPHIDRGIISSITGNVVTVPPITYAHEASCRVGNFSSNMVLGVPSSSALGRMAWQPGYISGQTTPNKIWDNVLFLHGGGGSYRGYGPLSIGGNSNGSLVGVTHNFFITDCAFIDYKDQCFSSHSLGEYKGNITFRGNVIYSSQGNGVQSGSSNSYTLDSCAFFGGTGAVVSSSQYNNSVKDSFLSGYPTLMHGVVKAYNAVGRCSQKGLNSGSYNSSLVECLMHPSVQDHTRIGALGEVSVIDSDITPIAVDISSKADGTEVVYTNIGGLETGQAIFRPFSEVTRDNLIKHRGTSSLRITPTRLGVECIREQKVLIGNGEALRLVGYIKSQAVFYNAGVWNPPTVTISGLGLAPVTFSASSQSSDAWEAYDISLINESGSAGSLKIAFTVTAQSALGDVWFDGTPTTPFVTNVRHYGFDFNESSQHRVVNRNSVASEALAETYNVVVDVGALTITSNSQGQEIYDYTQYWAAQPVNNENEVPFVTFGGGNYILADGWKLIISSAVSGGINLTGDMELQAVSDLAVYNIGGKVIFTVAGTYTFTDCVITEVINLSAGNVVINAVGLTAITNNLSPATISILAEQKKLDFTVYGSDGSLLTGYEWRLYESDPSIGIIGLVELAGEEVATQSSQNYSYDYTADTPYALQILDVPSHEEKTIRDVLVNANQSLTIKLTKQGNI